MLVQQHVRTRTAVSTTRKAGIIRAAAVGCTSYTAAAGVYGYLLLQMYGLVQSTYIFTSCMLRCTTSTTAVRVHVNT